jgi:hypothetical protein
VSAAIAGMKDRLAVRLAALMASTAMTGSPPTESMRFLPDILYLKYGVHASKGDMAGT